MGSALGVAERLLALEAAVAELRTLVQGMEQGATAVAPTPAVPAGDLQRLEQALGNARMAAVLVRAGYTSPEAVAAAPDAALLAIDGIGDKALAAIRARLPGSGLPGSGLSG
jgi:hypothetical protein